MKNNFLKINIFKKLKNMKNHKFLFLIVLFISILNVYGQPQGKKQGPPPWAPAHGYRANTRYIYFPEYNFYYDLKAGVYIYYKSNKWVISAELDTNFGNIDLSVATKIELDYTGEHPERFNREHKEKYRVKEKQGTKNKSTNKKENKTTTSKDYKRR